MLFRSNGHITSKQSLDAATAGGRIIGASNRGTVSQIDLAQTTSSADGGYIRFLTCDSGSTNPTERMRLLSGGGLTFNGDTAAANALSDYEEGTFNPFDGIGSAFTGESYGARYTKIGKVVHIDMRVLWTGTDNSGNPLVIKVPFSSITSGNLSNTGVVLYSGTQLESGDVIISHLGTNNNEVNLYRGSGGSFHSVRRNDVNGSYDMLIAFTYEVP